MRDIFDFKGRLACKVDDCSGEIEEIYKKVKITANIPVGGIFTIERDGVVTRVTRVSETKFAVESYSCAA